MLPLFFPVRKFFDHEVQVLVGFLTRPVTGYGAHDDAGTDEHGRDDQCNLHIKYICPVALDRRGDKECLDHNATGVRQLDLFTVRRSAIPWAHSDLGAHFVLFSLEGVAVDRAGPTDLWCAVSVLVCVGSPHTLSHADVVPRTPIVVATPTRRTCSHGKRLHTQSLRHIV